MITVIPERHVSVAEWSMAARPLVGASPPPENPQFGGLIHRFPYDFSTHAQRLAFELDLQGSDPGEPDNIPPGDGRYVKIHADIHPPIPE
jgi:hypothetical protein